MKNENRMFTNIVNTASFQVGKEKLGVKIKELVLNKGVKLIQEFEEALEERALLKDGPSEPEKCKLISMLIFVFQRIHW